MSGNLLEKRKFVMKEGFTILPPRTWESEKRDMKVLLNSCDLRFKELTFDFHQQIYHYVE